MTKLQHLFTLPAGLRPESSVMTKADEFLRKFKCFELDNGVSPLLLIDNKGQAYYMTCHLKSHILVSKTDLDAVLDPAENEEFKLNRDIYVDSYAYQLMENDAAKGRSFEDIVVEYDTSYRPEKPLKVFGGQHRINAIRIANGKNVSVIHGVRVYFGLTTEQKLDIATANNSSIAVSNDLLDRMQEEFLGAELRTWCHSVGLLGSEHNFADKRDPEGIITVRIARTLIVNFYKGMEANKTDLHAPTVCSSGPKIDAEYQEVRAKVNWSDANLRAMGEHFARLHKLQRERVLGRTTDKYIEFANKAIHPCLTASWAYIAGLFQHETKALKNHYEIVDTVKAPKDPLNAKALSTARYPLIDPETYRGLGTRISPGELGRMAEVFLMQATEASKREITPRLANAAIKSYEAKKASVVASKAKKGL
jgi:hypothetical protein